MTCKHTWQFTDGGTGALKCTRCNVETGPRTPEQLTQDMMQDVLTIGSAWSKDGERIDPMSVYRDTEPQYKLHEPRPTSITFFGMKDNANIEVMRLSRDGVWVNPDISCDEAAKKVLEVLDNNLKLMLEKEREAGRKEAEAELDATNRQVEILSDALAESRREVTWGVDWGRAGDKACVSIIKRLPNGKIKVMAVEYQP